MNVVFCVWKRIYIFQLTGFVFKNVFGFYRFCIWKCYELFTCYIIFLHVFKNPFNPWFTMGNLADKVTNKMSIFVRLVEHMQVCIWVRKGPKMALVVRQWVWGHQEPPKTETKIEWKTACVKYALQKYHANARVVR